ncbi:uncharacterized protein N7473_001717 [Penicillium subrubescens]|uniref:uncharacterized protein n=1 Tax=Penicillium subrubescens TaxID=1316194 RepID=UPI002544F8EE|nr:uncharacterized protein N7473_001600 [Penicillium subrubescens]XP_057011311.1 uncharacterized protein N7473_001717 [Penicillium subrubescens]KAJ5904684.1 hypothetical protein N7473_001600 [Penicillium subrubescens]KAJ5904801.1 hypothetical protein N7473_001717 [Penicillium subrubescens]
MHRWNASINDSQCTAFKERRVRDSTLKAKFIAPTITQHSLADPNNNAGLNLQAPSKKIYTPAHHLGLLSQSHGN